MIAVLILALALLQDPAGEEIRSLLRRLESLTDTPAETAEIMLRLGQAVEQAEPRAARTLLGDALRADRLPAVRRMDLAETLFGLRDTTWIEDAGRIALDASESPETRMRAALLLARANAPRAGEIGDETARAMGAHLREGTSRELQRQEIDFLFRLALPGSRLALRDALADDGLDPVLRLEIAERLHATGGLDRRRDARAALARIKGADAALSPRVDRLLAAIRGIDEDPASGVDAEPEPAARKKTGRNGKRRDSANKVNLIIGGTTLVLLAVLLGWRKKA